MFSQYHMWTCLPFKWPNIKSLQCSPLYSGVGSHDTFFIFRKNRKNICRLVNLAPFAEGCKRWVWVYTHVKINTRLYLQVIDVTADCFTLGHVDWLWQTPLWHARHCLTVTQGEFVKPEQRQVCVLCLMLWVLNWMSLLSLYFTIQRNWECMDLHGAYNHTKQHQLGQLELLHSRAAIFVT